MIDLQIDIQTADPVHVQIERFFRRRIQTGQIPPSTRLPSTDEMVRLWRVKRASISQAMSQLALEGLIERKSKRGTFVKARDDRAVIGVLIGPSLNDESEYFNRALVKALHAQILQFKEVRWTCFEYDGLNELEGKTNKQDFPVYRRLVHDLQNYSFKGFIDIEVDSKALRHWGTKALRELNGEPNLPTVKMWDDVKLDFHRFTSESVKTAVQQGLKKIVYLRTLNISENEARDVEGLIDTAKEQNLPAPEIHRIGNWWPNGTLLERLTCEKTLSLIDQWQQSGQYPDLLLISDDIATRGATLALIQKAVHPPKIITLANEGIEHHYGLPVTRHELSPNALARELLEILGKRMNRHIGTGALRH
ncbi:MAG: winged helix-turn-helix domain-containing protein [Verrucomicrobiae bacterium]|nr:winged helix-turn-helix domain-containing protein [Verrucomicrobiae bacterium]